MRSSTKSLLVSLGTVAAVAVSPLILDTWGGTPQGSDAPVEAAVSATASASPGAVRTAVDDAAPSPSPSTGSAMGGDLPPELLPNPPYPQCPVTEEGAWWTDPGDPYTCIDPGSVPFHEPTPPGIDPELLKPIFENPGYFHEPTPPGIDPELLEPIFTDPAPVEPAPATDCRTAGTLQCTVSIMGQDYVVSFSDGKPVGVVEAR
ncbi:hypothetical protein AC792_11065 [Arthrobacter sp. RIT-PI-e]|uniref:hypothetical protein n=1 Tax=Arthrobacter sp. RIT-PI-e TaxID=1681197 RepID=UPI000675C6A6|nr:hypothetical protein [Arthrobacter sp. RIT-PI-e]KNC18597.1 hypothetical protein AC792_11065 [Arthrobacter sp. RIT-PI-e]